VRIVLLPPLVALLGLLGLIAAPAKEPAWQSTLARQLHAMADLFLDGTPFPAPEPGTC
jgi:hypothetical protein